MRVTLTGFGVCAAAAIGAIVFVAGVAAHGRLDESTPAVGEVLSASPTEVSITFSQDVQKIGGTYGIDVFDESGAEVTSADAVLNDDDRRIMTVALPAQQLPVGRYVVEFKNVSDGDGDPLEGAYAFYVGRQPTEQERALDLELARVEEETPTAQAATPTTVPSAPTSSASATPAAITNTAEDDGGGNIVLFSVLGAIALIVVLVIGGYVVLARGTSG